MNISDLFINQSELLKDINYRTIYETPSTAMGIGTALNIAIINLIFFIALLIFWDRVEREHLKSNISYFNYCDERFNHMERRRFIYEKLIMIGLILNLTITVFSAMTYILQ